jgi:hypothetical protein
LEVQDVLEIVLGAILIVLTAALSERAKPRKKKWRWALFVLLAIAQAAFQIAGRSNERKASEKLQGDVSDTKAKLDVSLLEQARMGGHLEGIRSLTENLSRTGLRGMKEFAAAVTKLAENQRAANGMTNKQLCEKSIELAERLRALNATQRSEDDDALAKREAAMDAAKTPDERNRAWLGGFNQHVHATHEYELGQMLGDILYVRDALQQKLPSEPEPDFTTRIVFSGHLAGSEPLVDAANYFDVMARRLCVK